MKRLLAALAAFVLAVLPVVANAQTMSGPSSGYVPLVTATYTVGSGGNFPTVTAAIAALNQQVLPVGSNVTLLLLDGQINEPGTILIASSFAKQITIQGQHVYSHNLSSIQSSSGSAGTWTYVLNLDSASNVVVGDYLTIYGLSGGANPTYVAGVWPVTAVSGNQVTITTSGHQGSAASGSVTGTVVDLKASLKFTNADGFDIWNGATALNIQDFNIVGDGTNNNGISNQDVGRVFAGGTAVSVSNFGGNNVWALYNAEINGGRIVTGNGGYGFVAQNGGTIDLNHLVAGGPGANGVESLSSGSISWGSDAVVSGANGQGFYAAGGGSLRPIGTTTTTGNVGYGVMRDYDGVAQLGTLVSQNNGNPDQLAVNSRYGYLNGGSPPTLSGTCTTSAQVGGNTAGKFTATCTSQTVILTFAGSATNGWTCEAKDLTTPADSLNETAYSATSCTLTGTTAASDSVVFSAQAF